MDNVTRHDLEKRIAKTKYEEVDRVGSDHFTFAFSHIMFPCQDCLDPFWHGANNNSFSRIRHQDVDNKIFHIPRGTVANLPDPGAYKYMFEDTMRKA